MSFWRIKGEGLTVKVVDLFLEVPNPPLNIIKTNPKENETTGLINEIKVSKSKRASLENNKEGYFKLLLA